MFADDIVICNESKGPVEEKLESWMHRREEEYKSIGERRNTSHTCMCERGAE